MVLQYPVIYCKSVVDFSEIFILKKKKKAHTPPRSLPHSMEESKI